MSGEAEPHSVLVVDDDRGLCALIARRLEREGLRAVGVDDGAKAIDWLCANHADLMLLDLKLPDMTGDELLRTLAKRKRDVPFIVITGQGDERVAVRMMKQGARDFLMKDGAFLELLPSVVTRAIEQSEREARLAEAEQSLLESQRTLATLMSNLPGMAYRCRREAECIMEFVSGGCFDLTGYHPDDLIDSREISYSRIIHPDDRAPVWAQVEAALAKNEPYRLTYRILTAAGDEKWVWEQGRAIAPPGEGRLVLEGFIFDLTERKHAEEALRRSETMLVRAEQIANTGSWEWDIASDELLWSEQMYRIFGLPPGSPAPSHDWFVTQVHPDDRQLIFQAIENALSGRKPYDIEYRVVTSASSKRWIHSRGEVAFDERGRPIRMIGAALDITERKQAEDQLRHSQKIDAVGTLASGVAHDFNNLLTAIFGYNALVRKALPDNHPAQQFLGMADDAIQQASGVTKSLLTFSHKAFTEKSPVNFARVVADSLRLLRRVLPASIEVIEEIPPDLRLCVNADPTQLQQVLMNLAVNARDAMPNGGQLRIRVHKAPAVPKSAAAGLRKPRAVLTVTDTGGGMSDEITSRIFEPFFTTKPRGEGTGLGMAIVHGIVTDHGGSIGIASEVGRGTCVTIALPTCGSADAAPRGPVKTRTAAGRGELILVVEDDEHVRSIVVSALRSAGYEVAQAADGIAALATIDRYDAAIRLLLLDFDLPRLNGLDCLRQARVKRPGLPALLVTGSTKFGPADVIAGDVQVLRKPFRMSDLTAAVAHTLADSSQKVKEAVP